MKKIHPDLVSRITPFLEENYKGKKTSAHKKCDSTFSHLKIDLEVIDRKNLKPGMVIEYGIHETPFGNWLIALVEGKIATIAFLHGKLADQLQDLSARWNNAKMVENMNSTLKLVKAMFDTSKSSKLTALVFGTPFQIAVWKTLLDIREGSVVSYGDVAKAIGKPRAVRAVGTAVGTNPIAYLVPCHRVITGDGKIGQYFGGTDLKISILGSEMVG